MSSLEKGEDIAKVVRLLPYQKQLGEFDLDQKGKQHTFFAVKNNETGASFGLYFINRKLTDILSYRDAGLLLLCRDLRMPDPEHWSEYAMEPMSNWVASRSVLGKGNAAADQDPESRFDADYYLERQHGVIETSAMLLVYSPFFDAGAPFLAYGLVKEQLPGEKRQHELQQQAEDENVRKEKRREVGFLDVQIGMRREQLIELMGESDMVQELASASSEYLWFGYYHGVRVDSGRVKLKETPTWRNYFWRNYRGPLDSNRAIINKYNLHPEKECW
jgi:hypothetical protein